MAKLLFPGISVITAGPALGHDMMIDAETLNQVQLLGEASEPVKVLADHSNQIDRIIGMLYAFRIDGNRVRADLELLSNHPDVEYFSELIQKLPDQIGFSISFSGIPDEDENGTRLARVSDLLSVDLVTEAAANASVYSAPVDTRTRLMTETKTEATIAAPEVAPVPAPEAPAFDAQAAIATLTSRLDEVFAKIGEIAGRLSAPVAEPAPEPTPAVAPAELAAKVEETKLEAARAVAPLVAQPEESVDPLSKFLAMPKGNDRRKFLLENKTTLRALARNRS
jgi:phage head maturation protease